LIKAKRRTTRPALSQKEAGRNATIVVNRDKNGNDEIVKEVRRQFKEEVERFH